MNLWRTIRDVIRGPALPATNRGPTSAWIIEYVQPDARLVSNRAPVPVYAIGPAMALPANKTWYASPAAPQFRFGFTLVRCPNGECRAYIREQPGYRGRATDAVTTHRLSDRRGNYVCWTPMPRDPVAMLKVARLWADRTVRYITTGVRLEAP